MSDNKSDQLEERFRDLYNLFAPKIIALNSIITDPDNSAKNYEFFIDLLLVVYNDIQRLVNFFKFFSKH